ncbi:unnamed protein product, partial [Polarella glacialis]
MTTSVSIQLELMGKGVKDRTQDMALANTALKGAVIIATRAVRLAGRQLIRDIHAVKAGGMPGLEDFKEAFLAFDTDGDGTLDLAELLDAFKTCAPAEVPEEELKQLFLNIDTSGDLSVQMGFFGDDFRFAEAIIVSTWRTEAELKCLEPIHKVGPMRSNTPSGILAQGWTGQLRDGRIDADEMTEYLAKVWIDGFSVVKPPRSPGGENSSGDSHHEVRQFQHVFFPVQLLSGIPKTLKDAEGDGGTSDRRRQQLWLFNPRLEASSCWQTAPPAAFRGSALASAATGVLPPSAVADASAPSSVNLVGLTAVGATLAAAASTSRRGQKVAEKSGRTAVVARRAETIAATAIANGNFTILVKALQKAGLVDGQKVTTAQSGQLAVQIAGGKVKDCNDVSETQHFESSECDFEAGERCVTSFLTMGSPSGLLFGITNIVGNFGTVFVDQSYWQSTVAANPKSAVKGFLIGGLVGFAAPFCRAAAPAAPEAPKAQAEEDAEAKGPAIPSAWEPAEQVEVSVQRPRAKAGGTSRRQQWFGWAADLKEEKRSEAWRESAQGSKMNKFRATLPAAKMKAELWRLLKQGQVVLVHGETGSGKTTQVGQFLLEQPDGPPPRIVVTQPRRFAAVSVARRVAEERGERMGEGSVGYVVRGETKMRNDKCQLLFCTLGVLLRRLVSDGADSMFGSDTMTHLILDEVHERSMDMDFVLTLLRHVLPKRPQLKVLLMSATMDVNSLGSIFPKMPPVLNIPGRTFPVDELHLEDVEDLLGTASSVSWGSAMAPRAASAKHPETPQAWDDGDDKDHVDGFDKADELAAQLEGPSEDRREAAGGRWASRRQAPAPVSSKKEAPPSSSGNIQRPPGPIDFELLANLIIGLANGSFSAVAAKNGWPVDGAILVFMPGAGEISRLIGLLEQKANSQLLKAMPLHGALS